MCWSSHERKLFEEQLRQERERREDEERRRWAADTERRLAEAALAEEPERETVRA
ncbi:MAG: hypothetical protein M3M94_00125 [Actinomycetota bacterium]|nr:hypothetical protein [Actinomycetota bacterium]